MITIDEMISEVHRMIEPRVRTTEEIRFRIKVFKELEKFLVKIKEESK